MDKELDTSDEKYEHTYVDVYKCCLRIYTIV